MRCCSKKLSFLSELFVAELGPEDLSRFLTANSLYVHLEKILVSSLKKNLIILQNTYQAVVLLYSFQAHKWRS